LIGRRIGDEGGFEWRERRVALTKHGEGPPILLFHGIHPSGWPYEWRINVVSLARTNTVYKPDFLGFGLSPDIPSWGNLLNGAEQQFYNAPVLAIVPGALLTATILALNFIGDGLRDAFDVKSRTVG